MHKAFRTPFWKLLKLIAWEYNWYCFVINAPWILKENYHGFVRSHALKTVEREEKIKTMSSFGMFLQKWLTELSRIEELRSIGTPLANWRPRRHKRINKRAWSALPVWRQSHFLRHRSNTCLWIFAGEVLVWKFSYFRKVYLTSQYNLRKTLTTIKNIRNYHDSSPLKVIERLTAILIVAHNLKR
jgi:hypothetical protein